MRVSVHWPELTWACDTITRSKLYHGSPLRIRETVHGLLYESLGRLLSESDPPISPKPETLQPFYQAFLAALLSASINQSKPLNKPFYNASTQVLFLKCCRKSETANPPPSTCFPTFLSGTGRTQRLDQDAAPQVLAIFHSSKHASRKYRRDSQTRPTCCPQVLAGFRSMAKTLPSILAEFRDNSPPQCTGQRIEIYNGSR